MNVVLFTGGRGNLNLIQYIQDQSYINLSLLINGFDDGLSTGTIRSANSGMLGPSDFRKNFTTILDSFTESNVQVKKAFEHRLTKNEALLLVSDQTKLIQQLFTSKPLEPNALDFITTYFRLGAKQLLQYTRNIDHLDQFSVGNIIIGGLYVHTNNFNSALALLTDFFDLNARMINVSIDTKCKLVAFDQSGNLLESEEKIVSYEGEHPLKEFYILSREKHQSLKLDFDHCEKEVKKLSMTPIISESAALAIEHADLILFGSGTQFSSLLPSYRICSKEILKSNARKVLLVNNEFDKDINNISLEEFTKLSLKEFKLNKSDFFDQIILDSESPIQSNTKSEPANLWRTNVSNENRHHNGNKLWNVILDATFQIDEICKINLVNGREVNKNILDIYLSEIQEFNKNTETNIRFSLLSESNEKSIGDKQFYLILDTTGKINLHDIVSWVEAMKQYHVDCIYGYRFYSRKQLILSFKKKLVESKFVYYSSILISNIVSMIYFIRFQRVVQDPFSGIYLIHTDQEFQYKGVANLLKWVHRNKIDVLSLPITYRTFKDANYLDKTIVLLNNTANLFNFFK